MSAKTPINTTPAADWKWTAGLVPWIALWMAELPLLFGPWGFTLSRVGAIGPVLVLLAYLFLGAVVSLIGWGLLQFPKLKTPDDPSRGPRWLFRFSAMVAWGALVGGLIFHATLFGNPVHSPLAAWISTLLGGAVALGLATLLSGPTLKEPRRMLIIIVLLPMIVSFAMTRKSASAEKTNVLLITIDTCNLDHLSTYGYHLETTPNLSRIAKESVKFNRAYCHVALTGPSHASLFTGLQPQSYGVYDNAKPLPLGVETLAEQFRDNGYMTTGLPGNLVMLEAFNMHQGFDRFPQRSRERGIKSLQWEHTLPWRVARVLWDERATSALMVHNAIYQNAHFFEARDLAGDANWFTWLHYFDAHAPYEAEASDYLESREVTDMKLDYLGSINGLFDLSHVALVPLYGDCYLQGHNIKPLVASPGEIRDLLRTYDAQLKHIDEQLGLLFDGLQERGDLDNTLIIITADHGEALYDRGYFGHSYFLHDDEMHVPLLIWYGDRLKAQEIDTPVALTDLAPTIYELTGITPPEALTTGDPLAGQSLVPLMNGTATPDDYGPVYLDRFDHARGIVTPEGEKLIYQAAMEETPYWARPWRSPQWLWFNLNADPEERINFAGGDLATMPEEDFRAFTRVQGTLDAQARAIDGASVESINFKAYLEAAVSASDAAFLKSIGYLQGTSSEGAIADKECIQPIAFTTAAEEFRRLTGIDPTPMPMGPGQYLLPPWAVSNSLTEPSDPTPVREAMEPPEDALPDPAE